MKVAVLYILMFVSWNVVFAKDYDDASSNSLVLTPSKCVTLKEGKVCYEDIEVSWHTLQRGNYCLFSSQQTHPLTCWRQARSGQYRFEFKQSHSVLYQLRQMNTNELIAKQRISVKWVYKNRPNSSWRLF